MKSISEKKVIWWEEQRAKGKYFWITKAALFWGISVFSFSNLAAWLFNFELYLSLYHLITYVLGGFVVGSVGWWDNESKYQNYLLENKIKKELMPFE